MRASQASFEAWESISAPVICRSAMILSAVECSKLGMDRAIGSTMAFLGLPQGIVNTLAFIA